MKEDKGTSWVADARKLLQDFVAPEVRAVTARLDASDGRAADRHTALLDMMHERDKMAADRHTAILEAMRERDVAAAERHQALLDKIESTRRELVTQIELAVTKSKLEVLQKSTGQAVQAPQ